MTGSSAVDDGWRRSNLGHLLFAATGRCIGGILPAVRAAGFAAATEAQLGLFAQIGPGGIRLTQLAARSGVLKQSTIELVDRAERAGQVTREVDPADTRAKIVRLTVAGEHTRSIMHLRSQAAEDAMARAIGRKRLAMVRRALAASIPAAERVPGVEQLLAQAGRRFVRDVLAAVHGHGYRDVTEALLQLFRNLDLGGARLTDVAARARATKQSMGGLVGRAALLGLVERLPDPADRRASIIRFTAAGLHMLDAFRVGVDTAENCFAQRTRMSLPALKEALCDYLAADPQDDRVKTRTTRTAALDFVAGPPPGSGPCVERIEVG